MSGFDLCGPLPEGTVVLEASAGTGKTYTIAALATRYVAEGRAELSQLMLVTFGRAATSELRDRVRESLVRVERALRDPAAAGHEDPLVRHLAAGGPAEQELRRKRLAQALAGFDAATIATTHGFCQQMLATLGVAGDVDRDAVLVPDVSDLIDEVVDDVYLRRYLAEPSPVLTVKDARLAAGAAISDHDARLEPSDAGPASPSAHRYRIARDARTELLRRKRSRRILDYDDLLVLLRDALLDPVTGPDAAARVRQRYQVVMVDEFQDTDRVQWEILRAAFHGHRTLVLIGDPKQAIYAFRGADVTTYLDAAGQASATATLDRNWRSDAGLLRALGHLLDGVQLGDPRITVRPVRAAHQQHRLEGQPAFRLRQVTRQAVSPNARPGGKAPSVGAVRALIYQDVAAEIVRALGEVRLREAPARGGSQDDAPGDARATDEAGPWRALEPADIAVLTGRNADAAAVRDALTALGVPAVVSGQASVFGTAAARDWFTLLTALSQPSSSTRVAAAALTPFLGWDAARLAGAPESERDLLADRVRSWAQLLSERGVAALAEAAAAYGLAERLLAHPGGERRLTDLRHVAESLHRAATAQRLGSTSLTEWLRDRMEDAAGDFADERSRRLETDAAAVQVITVHSSKGLEFPVVYVPFGWDRFVPKVYKDLRYHDGQGARVLDLGAAGDPGYADSLARHTAEDLGEDLRLAYVALTRAGRQVVAWWAPTWNSTTGALTRLLLSSRDGTEDGRDGGGPDGSRPDDGALPPSVTVPDDDTAAAALARIASSSGGDVVHERVDSPPEGRAWTPDPGPVTDLQVRAFQRRWDATWRRLSYSGLTAAAHESSVPEEPETTGIQDEPGPDAPAGDLAPPVPDESPDESPGDPRSPRDDETRLRAVRSPMADLPGGAAFGTLAHEVLERVDTDAADLAAEVRRHCRDSGLTRGLGVDADDLAEALLPSLYTPLGPAAGGRALRDFTPADRLPELVFEFPLAGGDRARGRGGARGRGSAGSASGRGGASGADGEDRLGATLQGVAAALRRHVPADDPLAGYADRLEHPLIPREELRGYLTGSIDAVLRVRQDGEQPRYLVVDYKTNLLSAPAEELTAWHYRPQAMAAEMLAAHYPLQLLLYTVALHRYLRWRQPGYDPAVHLGGALYLFVRGMTGPDVPVVDGVPCGVMAWHPSPALVRELSDLLDGEVR